MASSSSGRPASPLTNEIGKVFHFDRLPGAEEDAVVAVPAVVPKAHIGVAVASEMKDIHAAHVHAGSAFIAFFPVHLDPGIEGFLQWTGDVVQWIGDVVS